MAIQQLNTIDKDADLMQRMRQSADLMRADPNMLNYYGQMRKERRAKEAANTAYQNLAAKSKGKIEFRNDPDNELGSPLIKKEKNFDENVRAGATDYSRDPKTEAMLSVESGDNRYRTHIDNDRQIVEDGSLAPVQEHMKGLMGNIVPGAIAAPPAQSSLAPSYNQSQPSSTVPVSRPPANPSITTGVPPERIAQATQDVFNDMKLGSIPANGGSASRGRNRSVNESYSSGNATPVTMKVQHAQAGFADMNPDVQGMYVDKEAADINNMALKAHGLDAIDNINDQKLKDATERFRALNQSLNPNFNADIQGGGFSGFSRSSGRSEGWNVSKGSGGQQADQSSFTASDISGAGERPGTLITKHNANTGISIVRPTANGKATQIPTKTIQGVLSGRITDTDFNKAEQDELKRLMKDGSIDKDGYVRKQIPLTSPVTAKLFEKLQTEHDRSLRIKQEQISASEESAKKTSQTIKNR